MTRMRRPSLLPGLLPLELVPEELDTEDNEELELLLEILWRTLAAVLGSLVP